MVWNKDVTFINGRPRHPQSQGLIEHGNQEVEKIIQAKKTEKYITDSANIPWASRLPDIMYSLNTRKHDTIEDLPYKVVFGCMPHKSLAGYTGTEKSHQ